VDVLEKVSQPVPAPTAGEVRIRVEAAGVNRADILQRQGRYPVAAETSPVLGLEVAGEIVELGKGVDEWTVGERVCTLTGGGAYAEYVVAPASQLLRWPQGYDAVLAACLPEACFTVWANVFQMGRLGVGETVLIDGGRGGVGTCAIQLARTFGAHVLATSGSAEGCRDCIAVGADQAINYRDDDVATAVLEATGGEGADVILDPIGAANFERNLAILALDGRLVMIGFTGGHVAEQVDLAGILARRLVVTGSAMRPRSAAEKSAIAAELTEQVWPVLDQGACRPQVAGVYPLGDVAGAHRLMEAGGYFGKVVLTVPD
jgi:putative PIG3 family NAD(P)H quinone oxidoreductase